MLKEYNRKYTQKCLELGFLTKEEISYLSQTYRNAVRFLMIEDILLHEKLLQPDQAQKVRGEVGDPPEGAAKVSKNEGKRGGASERFPVLSRYKILDILGKGGISQVYRAQQKDIPRKVALKVLKSDLIKDEEKTKRFLREIKIYSSLNHRNIVPIYDAGQESECLFFTMKLVEGPNLLEYVMEKGLLSLEEIYRLFGQIVEAMGYAHSHQIVHRDIKPTNILLSDGIPLVTDFSIAKDLTSEESTLLTAPGVILGTPSFMSPEQAEGKTFRANPATDIYSLGAVLFFLLTGQPPFKSKSAVRMIHSIINDVPPPPHSISPRVPQELSKICLKCLEKAPEDRYANGDELSRAFQDFVATR